MLIISEQIANKQREEELKMQNDELESFVKSNKSVASSSKIDEAINGEKINSTFYIYNQTKPIDERDPKDEERQSVADNDFKPQLFGKVLSLKKTSKVIFNADKSW